MTEPKLFDEERVDLVAALSQAVETAANYWAEKPWADDELDLKHGTKCYRLTLSDGSVEYRYGWPTDIIYRLGQIEGAVKLEIITQDEWEAGHAQD